MRWRTMTRRVIAAPDIYTGAKLKEIIEHDPDTFTSGRRNNDIVNWFIACRLEDLEEDPLDFEMETAAQLERRLKADFGSLMDRMTEHQQDSLICWNESYEGKIRRLVQAYGYRENKNSLYSIWKTMDYKEDVHEDQLELPV